jgi:hypothetical protein
MWQSWYIARVYVGEGLGFMNIYVANVLSLTYLPTTPASDIILAFFRFHRNLVLLREMVSQRSESMSIDIPD